MCDVVVCDLSVCVCAAKWWWSFLQQKLTGCVSTQLSLLCNKWFLCVVPSVGMCVCFASCSWLSFSLDIYDPAMMATFWLPAYTVSFIPLLSLTCLTLITRVRRCAALTSVYKEAPWPNFISPIFFLTRGRPRPKARRRAGSTWGCARFSASCLEDKEALQLCSNREG